MSNCVISSDNRGLLNNASLNSGVIASVTIIDSLFNENVEGIYNAFSGSGAGNCTACMTIVNSVVTGNAFGVYTAADLASTVTVLNSRMTDNALEAIISYGNAEVTVKNSTSAGALLASKPVLPVSALPTVQLAATRDSAASMPLVAISAS